MTIIYRLVLLLVVYCLCTTVSIAAQTLIVDELAADGLIVKFRANTSQSSLMHALSVSGLRNVQNFALVPGLIHVRTVAGETLQNTLTSIQTNPNVEYAEPNYYVNALGIPNDPEFANQYGLQNTGQSGGSQGADIGAVAAWDLQTGNDVIIAVIDTGVEYSHVDLQGNIWTNSGEIPNNGLDDDNNGFVDDFYGWDFSNNDNDPMDDMGHGTHVAGVIAARANNGIGIAGINWQAKIMSLKFIDAAGIGTTSNAIKALNYAVAMGAKISNNSWGGGAYTQGLFDTLVAANQAGHLFVAASGNNGINTDDPANSMHYPSSYDVNNVISVAATDEFDNLGSFSNYGNVSVDLAAPGRQIISLWLNNGYLSLDGTSMAAPFVAGAAGLLLSSMPSLSITQLKAALMDNVDRLPGLSGLMKTGGRLNLFNALSSISASISVTPNSKNIAVNDSLQFFAAGGTLPYNWSLTNTSVGQIDSAAGLFNALRRGVTQVIVKDANGFSARSGDIVVDQLAINPERAVLNVGQRLQFTAAGGVPPYAWLSSNFAVVQINSVTGEARAIGQGNATVEVSDGVGLTMRSGNIDVIFIADLSLSAAPNLLNVGDTFVFNADGGVPPYNFGSMDNRIVTVDSTSGNMRAIRPGSTQVFVTDSTGSRAVRDVLIQNIFIEIRSDSMRIDETQQLKIIGGTPPFDWRVTNSLVASVNNSGLLTALTSGSIKVTARDTLGNLATSDVILVTGSTLLNVVMPFDVVAKGKQFFVNVNGGIPPYQWSVSNKAVLSINPNSRSVVAKGVGAAFITIVDSMGETVSSRVVEVKDIRIYPQIFNFVVGDKIQYSASGGLAPYTWSVDNLSLAIISRRGLLTVKSSGILRVSVLDSDGITVQTASITLGKDAAIQPLFNVIPRSAILSRRSTNGLTFLASGGIGPYTFSLSNPIGIINSVTGVYNPFSNVGGNTTIIVTDANGNVHESGTISIR